MSAEGDFFQGALTKNKKMSLNKKYKGQSED
jgi:hypothetical protein